MWIPSFQDKRDIFLRGGDRGEAAQEAQGWKVFALSMVANVDVTYDPAVVSVDDVEKEVQGRAKTVPRIIATQAAEGRGWTRRPSVKATSASPRHWPIRTVRSSAGFGGELSLPIGEVLGLAPSTPPSIYPCSLTPVWSTRASMAVGLLPPA